MTINTGTQMCLACVPLQVAHCSVFVDCLVEQTPGQDRWLLDRELRLQRHQDDAVGAALVNQQIPLPG